MSSASTKPWQDEFSAALKARDRREKALDEIMAACTSLLLQAAEAYLTSATDGALAERLRHATTTAAATSASQISSGSPKPELSASGVGQSTPTARSPAPSDVARLRNDLGLAQQQQAALTQQVKSFSSKNNSLSTEISAANVKIEVLDKEKTRLERRCRDLMEEARQKDRRFQRVQDEMLALNMELNMVIQREEEVKKDNKELLDRWMALKGMEADAMNRESQWE